MIVKPLDRGVGWSGDDRRDRGRLFDGRYEQGLRDVEPPLATVYNVPVSRETLVERNIILVVIITRSTGL